MVETTGQRWHRDAQRNWLRDGVALVAAIAIGYAAFMAAGVAACESSHPHQEESVMSLEVSDVQAGDMEVDDSEEAQESDPAEEQEAVEGIVEMTEYETYYEPYYEPTYYAPAYDMSTDGLTMQGGVNEHDGRTETWYSSNVLYHYRTSEWHLDDEGFYRTDEGYYVVAASDMPEGTVFEGSKGECIVLDNGCSDGVTDYYVAW